MEEDEGLHAFGRPLKALTEDNVAVKKPIHVEDQIVTDEKGRRRFHGAFTGGFSAGFWNTVGSQHGWVPQMFTSSRTEKAEVKAQKPEDFMDDEDLGQFGIAPQVIQASDDFAKEKSTRPLKRKLMQPPQGPIPGQPVLAMLLRPVKDKAAIRILKSMGWRVGQGVGPRQTRKQKKSAKSRNERELYVWQRYCDDDDDEMKAKLARSNQESSGASDDDEDDEDDDISFAPDDIEPLYLKSKNDTFGFGYTGLLGQSSSQVASSKALERFNLFDGLEFVDKNNKKISISGQAFGVGALEEEDEDIYARDDMTKYDFSLEERKAKKKEVKTLRDRNVIEGFIEDASQQVTTIPFVVDIPANFKPRNWLLRKSRFEPLPEERKRELDKTVKESATNRSNLDAVKRGRLLGEASDEKPISKNPNNPFASNKVDRTKELLDRISAKSNNFTTGGLITEDGEEKSTKDAKETDELEKERKELIEKATKKTKNLGISTSAGSFKPFLSNEPKQQRYEEFLQANLTNEQEIKEFLSKIQPSFMSDWDREMEYREFVQAKKIYKPLGGIMSERFVTETVVAEEKAISADKESTEKKIQMERKKTTWKPSSLLCKRYNIPEPFVGIVEEDSSVKPKAKVSVFDYLEVSVNRKEDFQVPVIIPKNIEKPLYIPTAKPTEEKTKSEKTSHLTENSPMPAERKDTEIKANFKSARYVPKTKLEKDLEENKDKPLWEKTELYKAIFADSDDDEDDKEEANTSAVKDDTKNQLINELLLQPKTAADSNLLRNNSPPRGIFASLFKTKEPSQQDNTTKEKVIDSEDLQKNEMQEKVSAARNTFGPSLPPHIEQKQKLISDKNSALESGNTRADASEPPRIIFQSRASRQVEIIEDNTIYGPSLPANLKKTTQDSYPTGLDSKVKERSELKIEWVERKTHKDSSSDSESDSESENSSDSSCDSSPPSKKMKSKKAVKKKLKKKESKKDKKQHKKQRKKNDKKREKKSDKKHKKNKKKTKS